MGGLKLEDLSRPYYFKLKYGKLRIFRTSDHVQVARFLDPLAKQDPVEAQHWLEFFCRGVVYFNEMWVDLKRKKAEPIL